MDEHIKALIEVTKKLRDQFTIGGPVGDPIGSVQDYFDYCSGLVNEANRAIAAVEGD